MTMYAIRREDATTWPMPWATHTGGCCSHPVPWTWEQAVHEVMKRRGAGVPVAVYKVSPKGRKQEKVYP